MIKVTCAQCGEAFPCSDSQRRDIFAVERAKHYAAQRSHVLYLNVYAITRHYGGPEEGGWYYNAGDPIASVPFRGRVLTHEEAPQPGHDVFTTPPTCKNDEGRDCEEQAMDAGEGDDMINPCTHVIRVEYDREHVEQERDRLKRVFFDTAEGDIYSVLGGVAVEVHLDWRQGERWPTQRPRYS